MYSNDELVIQATMEDEANTNTYEDEHLKVISLFAFTSGAKFGSQIWRLKVREKESHDKELFIKLVYKVKEYDYYFLLKKDCTRMYSFKKKNVQFHIHSDL
jgi:hypothetical protein